QNVGDCFELIEREYFVGPWVLGERYSVSDMYLFTLATWLEGDGVDIARFPKVAAHRERMRADPVVQRVLESHSSAR
ncbi:MAG TPA: glutathione S-transferase family protein, partial [Roseateles sp.]|nr:glutathione S-transferase family protein [Roseateles sp.]